MAALVPVDVIRSSNGIDISSAGMTSAAVGGDTFPNTGKEVLVIENTNASPMTLTIATTLTVDGLAVTDQTATIPATTGKQVIGPFPLGWYNDQQATVPPVSGGNVNLTYSSVTGVKVKVLRVTPA